MKLLIVAATEMEIAGLISDCKSSNLDVAMKPERGVLTEYGFTGESEIKILKSEISFLITGVGMVATAFALGRHLAFNRYDLVINLGITGCFDRNIPLGSILEVSEDTFAELGAEDDMDFIPLSSLGFGEEVFKPSASLADYPAAGRISQATAITVNKIHGNKTSIMKVIQQLNPQLESMEGAAFFYACLQAGIPCIQIRAVSNYVEKRNRANWQIGLAIKNLNNFAIDLLNKLNSKTRD